MIESGNLCSCIDHTLLKPEATAGDISRVCEEARLHRFYSVCVNGCWVQTACTVLKGSGIRVVSVVGFPLGAMSLSAKEAETEIALNDGADEIDFVLNIGRLIQGDTGYVQKEIANEVRTAQGRLVKVIIETRLLSKEEKILACRLAADSGAHFVKTSTGFGGGGATVEDVRLMREIVGPDVGVKASGGIRDFQTAMAMIAAGATRLGTSASVAIVKGDSK